LTAQQLQGRRKMRGKVREDSTGQWKASCAELRACVSSPSVLVREFIILQLILAPCAARCAWDDDDAGQEQGSHLRLECKYDRANDDGGLNWAHAVSGVVCEVFQPCSHSHCLKLGRDLINLQYIGCSIEARHMCPTDHIKQTKCCWLRVPSSTSTLMHKCTAPVISPTITLSDWPFRITTEPVGRSFSNIRPRTRTNLAADTTKSM
jgi:hypothetical protein